MFGDYLKSLRESKGLSQRQLAYLAGLSNTEISKLESGGRKKPSPAVLKKIAPHLGVPYEELLKKAGIIESGEFIYTPPEESFNTIIRKFQAMEKDEQYSTIKKLFDLIVEDMPKKRDKE